MGRNIKQIIARKGGKYGKIWAGILSKLWPGGRQMWINMGRNITQIVVREAANMAHIQSWMHIVSKISMLKIQCGQGKEG
jgi:hypothetical protein